MIDQFETQSEKVDILMPKLVQARHKIERIEKNDDGRFPYATFDYIISKVEPVLHEYGLYIGFMPRPYSEDVLLLEGKIWEETSGQFIRGISWAYHPALFQATQNRSLMQENGSNLTYAKRYLIRDMLSLEIRDEDPDGDKELPIGHEQKVAEVNKKEFKIKEDGTPVTSSQMNFIKKLTQNFSEEEKEKVRNKWGDPTKLTKAQASELIKELQ
jgi:hypothetical protein